MIVVPDNDLVTVAPIAPAARAIPAARVARAAHALPVAPVAHDVPVAPIALSKGIPKGQPIGYYYANYIVVPFNPGKLNEICAITNSAYFFTVLLVY